ncbi:MAG: DUF2279 domain-containing protein [Bacteroidetes bacterium]|nr:MAG: DUF2279 domain-containing protein [Bacteroidota bacterium]
MIYKLIQPKYIIIIILTIIFNINLLAQSNQYSEEDENFYKSAKDYIVQNINKDSVSVKVTDNKTGTINYPCISVDDFKYSENQKYLIDGSLPYASTHIKPLEASIIGGVYIGVLYAQHVGQMNTIWKQQTKFRFVEDGEYALYADKPGHFFGCYFTSYLWSETLMLAGFSWETSTIIGSALGFAYSSYVEILDGFGANWGFSPTDELFNFIGAGYFLAQHYIPVLQNFSPKFMYIPANWHGEHKRAEAQMFIDDYSSHTMWLSVNVHNLLPESMKEYWPSWMELSFGYAARNLGDSLYAPKFYYNGYFGFGSPRFIISLDYNLVKLLPKDGAVWNWLRQSLNFFKFPSPAIEFGEVTKFYLMYPFPIKIGNVRF